MKDDAQQIAYPIETAFELLGLTRTRGYQAIATGELRTYKDGRRRNATRQALLDYAAQKERDSNAANRT